MWTYRARIIDVIDSRTVDVEVDLGFHIRTDARVILTGVLVPPALILAWVKERAGDSEWPFVVTLERNTWRDFQGKHERYVGTVTTPNGDSLNEHMARWSSDNPF